MNKLLWHVGSATELAQLLATTSLQDSAAVSGATLYRVSQGDREKIAISMPDGQTVFIEPEVFVHPNRRRREPSDD